MARVNRYNPNTGRKDGAAPTYVRLPPVVREAIAEAVHLACCELRGEDGPGGCHMYAAAGLYLLRKFCPDDGYAIQAGSMALQPDPADPSYWFMMIARDGGFDRGELHCWLANPAGQFADFSARHYRAMYEGFTNFGDEVRTPWRRPDPPSYLWCNWGQLPAYAKFQADRSTTESICAQLKGGLGFPGGLQDLFRATARHLDAILVKPSTGEGPTATPEASR